MVIMMKWLLLQVSESDNGRDEIFVFMKKFRYVIHGKMTSHHDILPLFVILRVPVQIFDFSVRLLLYGGRRPGAVHGYGYGSAFGAGLDGG